MTTGKNLVRRLPRENDLFQGFFDRFLDEGIAPWSASREGLASWSPAVDVRENDSVYEFVADLPGLDKNSVDVSFEDNILTISGERKFEEEEQKGKYRRVERRYGSFTRSFSLPGQVDAASVEASFADGVLTVRVPKSEAAKARKIKIQ